MSAEFGTTVVTWGQVGAISALLGAVLITCGGFVMKQVSNLGKRLDDHAKHIDGQRELIEANHREVLRHYATQEMVTQVERRLTETVTQIGADIRQLTGSIQQLFSKLVER